MAKAYGLWAGEEPYNCTKRGTVIIDKHGKIAHYEEVPMREARKSEELAKLVAASGVSTQLSRIRLRYPRGL